MKHTYSKFSFAILFTALTVLASAQNQLVVELVNGNTETFAVADIRSIKFGTSTMILNKNNGANSTWNIADIAQYHFSTSTGISENSALRAKAIAVFPNPVSDLLEIQYINSTREQINIELLDATGRIALTVYTGTHFGKQSYKQNIDLSAGLYFCRITANGFSSTKPFIIQ